MKNNLPDISIGQSPSDPFVPNQRSKSREHSDRLRSDFYENKIYEKSQKLTEIEEKQS